MARYVGPVCRICRRYGEKYFLKNDKCLTNCTLTRRPKPPGQAQVFRRRLSDWGIQLQEKQKAKYVYGVLERQLKRYFEEAVHRPGVTGEVLLQILERRLDNVVFRLGFGGSRPQARQLAAHGHFLVNGRPTHSPSMIMDVGDTVAWREGSTKKEYYRQLAREIQSKVLPGWLSLDMQTLTGRVLRLPGREEVEYKIDERAMVGYYSR
ncbi:MAG: 30S ribosomal protein S4 [Chloroflexi bacterium]|nr:30S ribosomal protein S4 [Chloroflexota bacterium]